MQHIRSAVLLALDMLCIRVRLPLAQPRGVMCQSLGRWVKQARWTFGAFPLGASADSLWGRACRDQLAAKAVEALRGKRVVLVSGGWRHTVVADEAGSTYSWGWNKVRGLCPAAEPPAPADWAICSATCGLLYCVMFYHYTHCHAGVAVRLCRCALVFVLLEETPELILVSRGSLRRPSVHGVLPGSRV